MRRAPWSILFALLLGVGLGLAYAWVLWVVQLAQQIGWAFSRPRVVSRTW